jgi:hypothetical protein
MLLQDNDLLLIVFQYKFDLGKPVLIGQYIFLPQTGWVVASNSANC